jgi:filamentous hemagglutinin
MASSGDPNAAALNYIATIYNGQTPTSISIGGDLRPGMFIATMPDGASITFRPAGQASSRTLDTTANVDINDSEINALNGGARLKLKFPKR